MRHSHTQDAEKLTYPKNQQSEIQNFVDFFGNESAFGGSVVNETDRDTIRTN